MQGKLPSLCIAKSGAQKSESYFFTKIHSFENETKWLEKNEDECAVDVDVILLGLFLVFTWDILFPGQFAPFVVYFNPISSFVTSPIDYCIIYCV